MSAATLIPSLLPMLMVVAMRRAEARIHRQLVGAGAYSAESAVPLTISRSFDRRRLDGLLRGGAVRLNADGRHFLDVDGWNTYQQNRRRRVRLALALVVAVIGIAIAVFLILR